MMKNMKRHTKPVISIVLALVLIVSTVAVGIIATNAAYLNGKPKSAEAANAEADVADANAVGAKADDTASVGAKAPEAVGANAGESVGKNIDACGSENYCIYFQSKNGSNFDIEYYNAYNVEITVTVADLKLDGNDLKFKVKKTEGGDVWYGNNNIVIAPGADTVLADHNENGGYFQNAKNYTSIKFKVARDGNNLKMYWVSGVSTSYTISYNDPANGSFTTNPTSANSGSEVTFVAMPNTGYEIDTVTVMNGSTAVSTTKTGNTYKFTMPSANVNVTASFKKAKYDITANATECTVAGFTSPAEYGSTVNFTVTPHANYALKTLTVKQGTTTISVTDNGGSYSFTMPAGAVTITATCATTSGAVDVYFKSATAWVYHPFITVNDGAEKEMTFDSLLQNGPKASVVKPKSDTGSLRYAWYKVSLTGVDTSKPVTIKIRGKDTYMEAEGTFNIGAGSQVYLACDNLMEGSTLVDLSSQTLAVKDFYDTPLHMVATAAEIAKING